jgi:hypothetical protein
VAHMVETGAVENEVEDKLTTLEDFVTGDVHDVPRAVLGLVVVELDVPRVEN